MTSNATMPQQASENVIPQESQPTQNLPTKQSNDKTISSTQQDTKEHVDMNTTDQNNVQPEQNQNASSNQSSLTTDPLATLGTMWSGWMSQANTNTQTDSNQSTTTTATTTTTTNQSSTDQNSSTPAIGPDWFQGAGRMWESAVRDVGDRLKTATTGMDSSTLGEQVNVFRQKSGQFVEDMSKSVQSLQLGIDHEQISKRAEIISSSTKDLFQHASQAVQKSHKEALEIFVDSNPTPSTTSSTIQLAVAPWDQAALPESEKSNADALRKEMLKLVVDSIYSKKKRTDLFLLPPPDLKQFKFDFDSHSKMAMAALDTDKNMRRLRAGLVPGKMKEDIFWKVYFYHVNRIRQTLIANNGVMPETQDEDEDDDDPATFFGDDGDDEELAALDAAPISSLPQSNVTSTTGTDAKPSHATESVKRDWDDEIDAIFDDKE